MDARSRPDELLDDGEARSVARYLACERQKRELRRERDTLVLALAHDLGEPRLAERMGVAQGVIGRLVATARHSLRGSSLCGDAPIVVRRLSSDRDRWADADAHYEALGSAPGMQPES
jgi:hypothetical protein